jgi:hypothetical protein
VGDPPYDPAALTVNIGDLLVYGSGERDFLRVRLDAVTIG